MDFTVRGQRCFAATGGQAFSHDKPAVFLIHGAGMDHSVWVFQTRYLAHHGWSVAALDLPGHGRSQGQPLDSIEAIADWLVEAMDALGVPSATLVGHSMGAITALSAAARHADRVGAIACCGVAAKMPVHPDLLAAAEANNQAAIDMVNAWAHGSDAHLGGHPASGLWLIGGGDRLLARARPGVLHADLAACNSYAGGMADAAALQCPALFLLGTRDRMTPAKAGRALAAAAPEATLDVIADCGHMMMTERPEETLQALSRFLEANAGGQAEEAITQDAAGAGRA